MGSQELFCLGLAWNCNPDLSLLHSCYDKCTPLHSAIG
jgi:hypothetical protein